MPLAMEEHVRRYIEVLDFLIRRSGLSGREIERRLAWSSGLLSKVLEKTKSLKVSHVLELLQAIGVEPLFFYYVAHSGESLTAESIDSLAEKFQARIRGLLPPMTKEELEEHLESAVRRALGQNSTET
jgi:hypothetical protein